MWKMILIHQGLYYKELTILYDFLRIPIIQMQQKEFEAKLKGLQMVFSVLMYLLKKLGKKEVNAKDNANELFFSFVFYIM